MADVTTEVDRNVDVMRIDRPHSLNAVTDEVLEDLAAEYAERPTVVRGKAKRLVNEFHDVTMETGLEYAIEAVCEVSETADHADGVAAFREGWVPEFHGK
jgi:enoyl-CoA hydratase/carnithine racemase